MERRAGGNRRAGSLPAPRYWFWGRRHSAGRRAEDRPGYVDLYPPQLLLVAVSIIALSFFDGYLTLIHLQNGGMEANPLMSLLLESGPQAFLGVKILATGLGVAILCLHSLRRSARALLALSLTGYLALLGYHLHLMGQA